MHRVLTAAVGILWMAEISLANTQAAPVPVRQAPMVMATFRLHVVGQPAAHMTFWVAYGPLGDRWGLVRLHARDPATYTATRSLPATGRTIFAYLAGSGAHASRAGPVPGDPVVTIRLIGPTSVARVGSMTVQWQIPIG